MTKQLFKVCLGPCGEEKSLEEFGNDKNKKSGKGSRCKPCLAKAAREYRASDPNRSREISRKYRENSRDKERRRYTRYNKQNPEVRANLAAYRRAMQKNATPSWLSEKHKSQIKEIYKSSKSLSDKFGLVFQVDHIVPLCGENVCGLHVPWNLQILEKTLNKAKSNSYDPEAIIYHRKPKDSGCLGVKCTKWDVEG